MSTTPINNGLNNGMGEKALYSALDGNVPASALWTLIRGEPTTGVAIVHRDGTVLWLNQRAASIFRGSGAKPAELVGSSWRESNDPRWVKEREEILRYVQETGKPLMLRTIWGGRQQISWVQPILAEPDGSDDSEPSDGLPDRFLIITRRVPGDWEAEMDPTESIEVMESELVELGALDALDALTGRELEVLALIGQGLSLKEIASTLHRSYKTIENHRGSIGRKLNLDDRVKLADIAQRAGLTLADAERTRVDPPAK
jgi:DNA-binding CsgD family transcriptional regulator